MVATLNKISKTHNTCEDSLWYKETDEYIIGVVSDGCSSGIKSAFASQLICYAVEDLCKKGYDHVTYEDFVYCLMCRIKDVCKAIGIDPYSNMLATALLFSYEKETKILKVRCFGDGVFYVNGQEYEIDQHNMPDYIGYYINSSYTDIIDYIRKYETDEFHAVENFHICSDGIHSFGRSPVSDPTDIEPIKLLLEYGASSNHLIRKFNILKNNSFFIMDDLTIISYVQD